MLNDLLGQQFGRYRLISRLGFGGFASVYLGQHVLLDSQQAAIKILHLTEVDIDMFRQEANTTATLAHPHIVRLLDFDIQQDTPYLILDYAPGGSLRKRHPKRTHLPLTTIVQYVTDIATALQYAHDKNIIHRDIKPENILVGRHGELLLSDFGIAVLSKSGRTSLERSYTIGGTAEYMAPEAFRGKTEKASDQYSLGVVVYEWLCGTPPFTEGNPIQLGFQHCYEPVPSLRDKLPALSARVEHVVLKALSKEPHERYATVIQFAEALEEASKAPLIGTRLLIYRGHGNGYTTGVWSPNGQLFATGGTTGIIQVLDAITNRLLWANEDFARQVNTLTWSPDGTRIASGSYDGTVQVWVVNSGDLLRSYTGHSSGVTTLEWSPDGTRIASGSEWEVQIWDVSSGQLLCSYSDLSGCVATLAWSPDGTRIASGSGYRGNIEESESWDSTVQVWEVSSGQLLRSYTGHSRSVTTLAWSPDSTRIAFSSVDNTVQVWDDSSGRHLFTYSGHSGWVQMLAWSPDGTRIASGSDDSTVQIWQAE